MSRRRCSLAEAEQPFCWASCRPRTGIGVGIIVNDKLVFAKGYGYRDYEKKLPFTPATLCQIASNSKLFTAVAAGMLVAPAFIARTVVERAIRRLSTRKNSYTREATLWSQLSRIRRRKGALVLPAKTRSPPGT